MPERVLFKNRMRIGDILTMTCGVRDFKKAFPDVEVGVATTCMHIWDNNPYVNLDLDHDAAKLVEIGPGKGTNQSNRLDPHMCNAFRLSIQEKLGVEFPQGPIRPDIWLTKEEYEADPLIERPYWIIVTGGEPGWPAKMYPYERWMKVVESLPDIQFVQLGASKDPYKPLHAPNVLNWIGKTEGRHDGIRRLFNLFLHAEGSIGLVSFHMHLSAAFNNPCVVVAGAREPQWFTHYAGHRYLSTDGCLPCAEKGACWACQFNKCEKYGHVMGGNIPKCVDIITPQDVVRAVGMYYGGGRLQRLGVKTKDRTFIASTGNVVGMEPKKPKKEKASVEKIYTDPKKEDRKLGDILEDGRVYAGWGLTFGGARITDKDWAFMRKVIEENNVETVLEFGSGLSTFLMVHLLGLDVESYEADPKYVPMVEAHGVKVNFWDGKVCEPKRDKYDLAFVDGPSGGNNREHSTAIGSLKSDLVIVHDAGRKHEKEWQEKYLAPGFDLAAKGGHRCHLWKRKSIREQPPAVREELQTTSPPPHIIDNQLEDFLLKDQSQQPIISPRKKLVRVVFNGRGEGGAERSVTWILNTLSQMGLDVIYHSPSGKPCRTFQKSGDPGIKVEDFQRVSEPCDFLFYYANDSVWNLQKPIYTEAMSGVRADRTVMGVNYKLGEIGKVDWTVGWDRYLFLSSYLKQPLLGRIPKASCRVLAPPTDLTEFYKNSPKYDGNLHLVRHSSQGDNKYAKNFPEIVDQVLKSRPDVFVSLMPPPTFLGSNGTQRLFSYERNNPPVSEFLSKGNCFWYTLPPNYTEGGPKVVMEAMASGLPVVCDNHSGMKDRLVHLAHGWLCDSVEDQVEVIQGLSPSQLKQCGAAARDHAKKHFRPDLWIEEILGESS